jgi:DNA-binding GntR family transcriptional regulator
MTEIAVHTQAQPVTMFDRPAEMSRATLAETVRQTLLKLILAGEFEQGVRLYPDRLSERFGVSATPVREALMQLASEGFIDATQRRGFYIRVPTPTELRELFEVRQGLELTAGELCIQRARRGEIGEREFEELAALQRMQEPARFKGSHMEKLDLNNRLHCAIVELSGNGMLCDLYQSIQVRGMVTIVQRGLQSWQGRLDDESAEHWAIIDALRQTDLAALQTAMRAHLSRSMTDALTDLAARTRP